MEKMFDTSFLDFVNHWCCSGVVSGKVCKLIPGVSSLKIGYVNEHGQPPWIKCQNNFVTWSAPMDKNCLTLPFWTL